MTFASTGTACAGSTADPEPAVPLSTPDAAPETGAPDTGPAEANTAPQDPGSQDAGSDAAAHPTIIAVYGAPGIRITTQIQFSLGKPTASEDELSTLSAIAEVIRERRLIVEIEGHADPTEKPSGISLRRAKHIHDRLVKLGVDPGRLKVVDRAATQPIAPPPSKANARVTFTAEDGPAQDR